MPANYVLLAKNVVGAASASSVTFSNIPQTGYTDLVVKLSARTNYAAGYDYIYMSLNGNTSLNSYTMILGDGSSAASYSGSGATNATGIAAADGSTATANTFSNCEIYIPNYASSNAKSSSNEGVTENNASAANTELRFNLNTGTSAITSITLTPGNGPKFVQYSTFYLYGIAKLNTTPTILPYATGGDIITTDGTYWYHTFISSGTFTPQKTITCDYLVVAGGGGGGSGANSGGGGAGGLRSTVSSTGGGGSLESKLFLTQGTSYTAVVGSGGAGGASSGKHGTNGGNSFFGNIISYGGGGGAPPGNDEGYNNGLDGGSGGGGGLYGTKGGLGVSGQGFAGAGHPAWLSGSNSSVNAGGGGGAGSVAATPTPTVPSSGGIGVQITALATPTGTGANSGYYAGGGAGNTNSYTPVGGLGGGGNMNTAGTANTGGGGGAGGNTGGILGGAGGSGIIIIRYLVA
jgi:hypothetical protein